MQNRRIGDFAAAAGDFPPIGEAAFGCCALDDEETRRRCRWCGRREYEAADDEVGVLFVAGEEGGEGDSEMVERRGYVDLDGGLGFHVSVVVCSIRRMADEGRYEKLWRL